MTVLRLRGREILKIRDGSKGQDIYNTQMHTFDSTDQANYYFTLELVSIYKITQ